MKIVLLLSIFILAFLLIGKKIFYFAQRNLIKNQSAWSGKDITIKYRNSKDIDESKGNDNYLKIIADESKVYLEDQTKGEDS
ncbi:hypothetical protein [Prochlorococcus marinus]|uniref:hypothetical protein n=1 Tax=Prochlorococcus marinus TaxID=1219 RepID=UPI0022B3264D|nr:hypothetical protein [Prochlorococcus marinus]